mmetsp:Transcript_13647/g.38394  ORF Transcript_13647/g.38394 Transcript_13647/m.38394 type:complete len:433 (+) Transcript_13647:2290-3588(+)
MDDLGPRKGERERQVLLRGQHVLPGGVPEARHRGADMRGGDLRGRLGGLAHPQDRTHGGHGGLRQARRPRHPAASPEEGQVHHGQGRRPRVRGRGDRRLPAAPHAPHHGRLRWGLPRPGVPRGRDLLPGLWSGELLPHQLPGRHGAPARERDVRAGLHEAHVCDQRRQAQRRDEHAQPPAVLHRGGPQVERQGPRGLPHQRCRLAHAGERAQLRGERRDEEAEPEVEHRQVARGRQDDHLPRGPASLVPRAQELLRLYVGLRGEPGGARPAPRGAPHPGGRQQSDQERPAGRVRLRVVAEELDQGGRDQGPGGQGRGERQGVPVPEVLAQDERRGEGLGVRRRDGERAPGGQGPGLEGELVRQVGRGALRPLVLQGRGQLHRGRPERDRPGEVQLDARPVGLFHHDAARHLLHRVRDDWTGARSDGRDVRRL